MLDYTKTSDLIEINSARVDIRNVRLEQNCINNKTGLPIGTANPKKLTFECETDEVLEGTSFSYHATTMDDNNEGTEAVVGTFPTYTAPKTDGTCKVTSYDLLSNTNNRFSTALNYASGTITQLALLNEMCTNCGITLDPNISLVNGSKIVSSNPFIAGENHRQALEYISEVNGGFFQMVNDDDYGEILKFTTPDINAAAVGEAFPSQYTTFIKQEQTLAINTVIMRDTIRGLSTASGDSSGGILYIDDNPLAPDEATRQALITGILSVVNGLTYRPFVVKGLGDPVLKCGDPIRILDTDNVTEYMSFVFAQVYVSTGSEKSKQSSMSAEAIAQTETQIELPLSKAERLVQKAMIYISELQAATDAAVTALNSPGASFVRFIPDISNPAEIYIMDTTDINTAVDVLRINSAGWGLSHSGYAGPYTVAAFGDSLLSRIITSGSITADDITTGTLSAAVVFAGILAAASGTFKKLIAGIESAQRIEQGVDENYEPYFDVYDNTNTRTISIRKNGFSFGNNLTIRQWTIDTKTGIGFFVGA